MSTLSEIRRNTSECESRARNLHKELSSKATLLKEGITLVPMAAPVHTRSFRVKLPETSALFAVSIAVVSDLKKLAETPDSVDIFNYEMVLCNLELGLPEYVASVGYTDVRRFNTTLGVVRELCRLARITQLS